MVFTRLSSVPVVGIIGGIGSGKSFLPRNVSRFRLRVIDADAIAHELLQETDVAERIVKQFGPGVVDPAGQISRSRLAEVVFGCGDKKQVALRQLEAILHPRVREESIGRIRAVPQDADIIILDAALLLEAEWGHLCDALIFVDTDLATRQHRVSENRGWSQEELARRERRQWPVERKRSVADYIVDNSGSPQAAVRQFEDTLQTVLDAFRSGNSSEHFQPEDS